MKIAINDENDLDFFNVKGFTIYHANKQAAEDIYEEVFNQKIYDFETNKIDPFIIDAGSNIGISALFFKMKYPLAKILCFEPDPNAFSILQKNIVVNRLKDVVMVNAALSKKTGFINFYGDVTKIQSDARGNSIVKTWGNQRKTSTKILVKTEQLSSYINSDVDFLKIDIEGAEQQVLDELGEKLRFISELRMEVHEAKKMNLINNFKMIQQILKSYQFEFKIEEQNIVHLLPKQIEKWIKKVEPKFYIVNAKRSI